MSHKTERNTKVKNGFAENITKQTESLQKYKEELKRSIAREKLKNIKNLEGRMKKIANRVLKGKYGRKKVGVQEREEEPAWFTGEIKTEIKERRRLNKKRKNPINKEEDKRKELYMNQRSKVQMLIRKEICKHEEKVVR